ncbi:hypothetical protein SAMN04487948_105390 [Halogranum amylolyticum]|uniref:DICT domain-containing protein n=1 Tax=Halogranum amylolyticum TaxID=660520 RepID=A0A1H8SXK6_9EURY|nr:DICT sensory domain-containing protein [Halogranum amylolyticum]SEO83490.1 hypothetical protein SAMN04487948_105390 [Halogranum amylolyticum]
MSDSTLSSLQAFFDEVEDPNRSLVVVNRREPKAVQSLLESAFAEQSVTVSELDLSDEADDVVVVLDGKRVVATSPLSEVMNALLLVNSDRYITGTSGVDDSGVPDVLTALDGVEFELRGYPASNKEKLLLIVISRYVERLALTVGDGRLRSTFQRLSRLADERGTRAIYERLAASTVDVHVYGTAGWGPPTSLDLTVHTGTSADYRQSWCVVFVPERASERHAALVALETGPNVWRGTWTYDPERVRRVDRYLERRF